MKKKKLKLPARINQEPSHGASLPRRAVRPANLGKPALVKDQPRIRGPLSRLSVKANTELGIKPSLHKKLAKAASKEIQAAVAAQGLPTDVTMAADTFNVLHCRVALNDGISVHASTILAREKLFGVIATLGWERTIQVLASCARLFAEVPATPLPKLSAPVKDQLHKLAAALDSQHINLRFVDREIAG